MKGKFKAPGYVYLMQGVDGRHKIGFTSDVKSRHHRLSFRYPGIKLLHVISVDNMYYAEMRMHSLFQEKQCFRDWDWFNLDADDIELIKSITVYENGEFTQMVTE